MKTNYREFIDERFKRLIENEIKFKLSSIAIIDMMHNDEELKDEFAFYWRISEAIVNKYNNISHEEKEQFLAIHIACVEVYNNK